MKGYATSFADPADVAAYEKWYGIYLKEGMSHADAMLAAFRHGDNGEGVWGDSTKQGTGPSCAL
ncbi:MAG: hypothetical protein M3Y86_11540, partial [Verrucomicrobiota bacterium]|nr:hypothetical protein [Verrucomicrobiota bacterium]